MRDLGDTIFAEATPPGRGGVSIIRLSGSRAREIAQTMTGPLENARYAYFRTLKDCGEALDQALVLWFEAGNSFTGEEVVELHLHGAPVVVRRVSQSLEKLGAREAEAGEFTRRAFLNDRMALTDVEGLGDLLAAETEAQRQQAMRALGQELQRRAEGWRQDLIKAGGLIAASLDFADEEVPQVVTDEVERIATRVANDIEAVLDDYPASERLREGYVVALIGPVNAGKSSLLNRLAGRDVAIISDHAGTTRDIIEVNLELNGLPVTLLDTAGLRDSSDPIEVEGIKRARTRAEEADLRLHLSPDGVRQDDLWQEGDLVVRTKSDLCENHGDGISVVSGDGVENLLDEISKILSSRLPIMGLVSNRRQAAALRESIKELRAVRFDEAEILAERLRGANAALAKLLGHIDVEDYLGYVFSQFCIGK